MKNRAGNFILQVLLLVFLVVDLGFSPALHAQTDTFFKGKTIRIVGGSGGFYESWARIIARQMGKHIPGNPNIIVQPMLGAGSLIAANYVYNVAKPDGLTLGMFLNTIYLDQLVGRKEVQFAVEKFGWIGSPVGEAMMLYMRADTPYKSIADIIKAKEPPKCGATGTASSSYILAMLLEETVGRSSPRSWAIKVPATPTWRWKKAKSFTTPTTSQLISGGNRSIAGTRRVSIATSFRPGANVIPTCGRPLPFMSSWINTRPMN